MVATPATAPSKAAIFLSIYLLQIPGRKLARMAGWTHTAKRRVAIRGSAPAWRPVDRKEGVTSGAGALEQLPFLMATLQLHYGATAKVFHWLIVALLIIQVPLGWLMPGIRRGMTPGLAISVHASIGAVVLLLIVARFVWRLTHPVAPENYLPLWQRLSSEFVHWLLYLVVFATTLTGWFFASARGWTIWLFGLVPFPRLVDEGSALGRTVGGLHQAMVWVLLGLIAVHLLAAFIHLFVYKDRVMSRMLPHWPPKHG
jgi:cytochrome b561